MTGFIEMDEQLLTESISRREMIRRTAIAAGALAFLPTLSACEGDMSVETLAQQIRQNGNKTANDLQARKLELVRLAGLAASGHNMQPWIFEIKNDRISILPDYTRRLPVVDPQDRELWISLGCALANLELAARSMGMDAETVIQPDGEEKLSVILGEANAPMDTDLSAFIPVRQCHRGLYNMKFVPEQDRAVLMERGTLGAAQALLVNDGDEVKKLQALVMEGDRQQYSDAAYIDELVESLRFNEREALESRDGLFSACSGNPKVPRFIGKLFVNTGMGDSQAEKDRQLIDSASGLILIVTAGDIKSDWVAAGQTAQRMALQMSTLGIAHSYMNQPIEVAALRDEVQRFVEEGVMNNPWQKDALRTPQLLLRYGYADEPMPYSLRRSVDEGIR
jgi:hypothetical protein